MIVFHVCIVLIFVCFPIVWSYFKLKVCLLFYCFYLFLELFLEAFQVWSSIVYVIKKSEFWLDAASVLTVSTRSARLILFLLYHIFFPKENVDIVRQKYQYIIQFWSFYCDYFLLSYDIFYEILAESWVEIF